MIIIDNILYGLNNSVNYKLDINSNNEQIIYVYYNGRVFVLKKASVDIFKKMIDDEILMIEDNYKQAFLDVFKNKKIAREVTIEEAKVKKFFLNKYTHLDYINDDYYIINFLYKSIDIIPKHLYDKCKYGKFEFDSIDKNTLDYLIMRGYMDKENDFYKTNLPSYKIENDCISVYFIMSYNCNLDCTYCFEKKKSIDNQIMSNDTFSDSINKIKNLSKNNKVAIILYGGEPLLKQNYDYISQIMDNFKNNENVCFRVITNGINVNMFIDLLSCVKEKIMEVVITLDGTRDIHDSRRKFKNGQGSYDDIVNSINLLLKYDINIVIRVNIDEYNLECQKEFIDEIKQNYNTLKISIQYNLVEQKIEVESNNCNMSNVYYMCRSLKKQSNINILLNYPFWYCLESFLEYPNNYPYILESFCMINKGIVIDADGKVYCCNEGMSEENFLIGNVNDNSIITNNYKIKDKKCNTCSLYLLCYGGCERRNLYNSEINKKCIYYDEYLDIVKMFINICIESGIVKQILCGR